MMYLKEYIEKLGNNKVKLFIDMDGVIVDYVVGSAYDFHKRRPLTSSIAKLEEISKMSNVELFILSVARIHQGIEEKDGWLDKYAPFFKKENRNIIAREDKDFLSAYDIKANFFKELEDDDSTLIMIDDDPIVLREIGKANKNVIRLKDTALVD